MGSRILTVKCTLCYKDYEDANFIALLDTCANISCVSRYCIPEEYIEKGNERKIQIMSGYQSSHYYVRNQKITFERTPSADIENSNQILITIRDLLVIESFGLDILIGMDIIGLMKSFLILPKRVYYTTPCGTSVRVLGVLIKLVLVRKVFIESVVIVIIFAPFKLC